MQRTILIALVTAVIAAGVATTATIVLTGDDTEVVATASPSATPVATVEVTDTPATDAPVTDAPATDGPARTDAPRTVTPATPRPDVTVRSAKSVDCGKESHFCSNSEGMEVVEDELDSRSVAAGTTTPSNRPSITMTSEVRKPDKSKASTGDEVGTLHVEVTVSNPTDDTFVFAKREIVLEMFKDGKPFDTFGTTGEGFEMTPGGKMNGTFDRPITQDGSYTWRAKIWYYRK